MKLSAPETIYQLKFSEPGRYWFIGKSENDIWVWDRELQNGCYGKMRRFRIGEAPEAVVEVKGPWNGSKASLLKETGCDFDAMAKRTEQTV
jgi:hypothetical protein